MREQPTESTQSHRAIVERWKKAKADLDSFLDEHEIKGHKRALIEILTLREVALAVRKASGKPTPNSTKPNKTPGRSFTR